jgi:hypothetical protein
MNRHSLLWPISGIRLNIYNRSDVVKSPTGFELNNLKETQGEKEMKVVLWELERPHSEFDTLGGARVYHCNKKSIKSIGIKER